MLISVIIKYNIYMPYRLYYIYKLIDNNNNTLDTTLMSS